MQSAGVRNRSCTWSALARVLSAIVGTMLLGPGVLVAGACYYKYVKEDDESLTEESAATGADEASPLIRGSGESAG